MRLQRRVFVCLEDRARRTDDGIEILPWRSSRAVEARFARKSPLLWPPRVKSLVEEAAGLSHDAVAIIEGAERCQFGGADRRTRDDSL